MAVYRPQEHCHICGEPLKAIHRNMGRHFVGDTFVMWDYDGHKCKKNKKYRQYMRELKERQNSPEAKAFREAFQKEMDERQAKMDKLKREREEAAAVQSDLDSFNDFLRNLANMDKVGFRRKLLAIKKFAQSIADKNS